MEDWLAEIEFENQSPLRRAIKAAVVNPLSNYLPAGVLKAVLRFGESEMAAANWTDPGGWRSMVISYDGQPRQIADKLLVGVGTMSMALRNRKLLGSRLLARLIDSAESEQTHVLCLGAGPGTIIMDAMTQADGDSFATLVDLSSDAFDYGRAQAEKLGLSDRVRFIQSDVRHIHQFLDRPPDVVKMLGICEYLTDEQIVDIASAVADEMPTNTSIVFNSISKAHGNDRFLRRVFGLYMIHRTPAELQQLMAKAGFTDFTAAPEPLGVYHVIVGHRNGSSHQTTSKGS